ncbi:MAG: hypothetical protein KF721_04595 [Ignavibacteriaceae bacterium]|nr:hypothetical protein [Ignavibacteriaceae bacterium]
MKYAFHLISVLLMTFFLLSCEEREEIQSKTNIEATPDSLKQELTTITAKFDAVYTNSNGAIFSFTDKEGKSYDFWETGENVEGLEFTRSLQPNYIDPKFDNILFEVTYTTRKKEFYLSGSEVGELRDVLSIVSVKELKADLNISVEDILRMQLSGTEPFWSIKFKEDYAEFFTPDNIDGVKIFYKIESGNKAKPKLKDVVKNVDKLAVEILGTLKGERIKIKIKREKCSDDMSDEIFSFSAEVLMSKSTKLNGCGKIHL